MPATMADPGDSTGEVLAQDHAGECLPGLWRTESGDDFRDTAADGPPRGDFCQSGAVCRDEGRGNVSAALVQEGFVRGKVDYGGIPGGLGD